MPVTYSHPFVHYQVHSLGLAGKLDECGGTFLPLDMHRCAVDYSDRRIDSIVYNVYLYSEDGIFVESFAHEWEEPVTIKRYLLHVPRLFVTRSVHDVFHRIGHLSREARELPVFQFSDL